MQAGKIIRLNNITRFMVERDTGTVFVFGDNMCRLGLGGQARAMRGLPNAIGVPTKWYPGTSPADFFSDEDLNNPLVRTRLISSFAEIAALMTTGGMNVVIPEAGLGTGLSELPQRAPKILAFINLSIQALESIGK